MEIFHTLVRLLYTKRADFREFAIHSRLVLVYVGFSNVE